MASIPSCFTREELVSLWRPDIPIAKRTRKQIFSLKLWCPKNKRKSSLYAKPNSKCKPKKNNCCGSILALLNARSINKKETQIYSLLKDNDIDFCALTETWCHDKSAVNYSLLTPPGYSHVPTPRTARPGGGIALIHRDSCRVKKERSK